MVNRERERDTVSHVAAGCCDRAADFQGAVDEVVDAVIFGFVDDVREIEIIARRKGCFIGSLCPAFKGIGRHAGIVEFHGLHIEGKRHVADIPDTDRYPVLTGIQRVVPGRQNGNRSHHERRVFCLRLPAAGIQGHTQVLGV